MKTSRLLIAAAFAVTSATAGFAQVSAAKAEWAKGPVQWLMTNDEKAMWQKLPSDDAAIAFTDQFNTGDFRLTNARVDVNAAQQKIIAALITQPNLTGVPKYGTPAAAARPPQGTPAPTPATTTPADTLKSAALETAVTEAK